jgi:hypothetical protein
MVEVRVCQQNRLHSLITLPLISRIDEDLTDPVRDGVEQGVYVIPDLHKV